MEVPTYRRAPNFSIPPDGPLQLGTVVEDLRFLEPLNETERVEISPDHTYRRKDAGFNTALGKLHQHEINIIARILGIEGLGGEVSGSHQKSKDTAVYAREVETTYFYPSPEYIAATMALPSIHTYMSVTHKKYAVYMITGLKIAYGASWSNSASKRSGAAVQVTVPEPLSAIVGIGPGVAANSSSITSTSVEEADPFILAYRATKIWYSWPSRDEVKAKSYVKGASMADDGGVRKIEQDGELKFIRDIGVDSETDIEIAVVEDPIDGIEPSRWVQSG
ncbi:hypothetical protein F4813DRAFT_358362 [Daldinia decipiens]|uniref:uncharacterized protein n=1 Tax=Daldinia decipiens TaxID=326647 RepID=UPI0020C5635D|nr:uncharacterized protein F4813DRAFT_358362 [Daldinia decipiens]KAI1657906.1 hypothetical protein F4813DRAFT_358362 [Daldinia decipiens]